MVEPEIYHYIIKSKNDNGDCKLYQQIRSSANNKLCAVE